ncbi:hypothetical protein [Chryseobacterium limigenitum]|nr:hypothetical protein [Chryseobacterium limigenitum]
MAATPTSIAAPAAAPIASAPITAAIFSKAFKNPPIFDAHPDGK